ncbi:MAG TPA: hypothetical protein VN692_14210 [Steroidobacteraceae bacterium]|nr:hypothetical protein [Steroidobacteraceae bacterium]
MALKTWRGLILPALLLLAIPAWSPAQVSVGISINVAPPELPIYDQPPIPGDGYLWTPGYWAWSDDVQDFYWVPGTWVLAPQPGYLWTPGYWMALGGLYRWHQGYWGPRVGFYGGVDYGYGYGGEGYQGGYWRGGRMYYNRSVNNISNTRITNVYNKTVINNVTVNRVSYNGGNGGVRAQPSAADQRAARDRHIPVTSMQRRHDATARANPQLRVSENKGRPPIAATSRPARFSGAGVVPAKRSGSFNAPNAAPNAPRANPSTRSQPSRGANPAESRRTETPAPAAPQPRVESSQRPTAPRRPAATPRSMESPRPATVPPRPAEPAQRPAAPPRPMEPQRQAAPPRPTAPPRAMEPRRQPPQAQPQRQAPPPQPAQQARPRNDAQRSEHQDSRDHR